MLNLFLAILLGNFDSARQLMAKKRAFEEFSKLNKKKVPLQISLIIVLGDLGEYIVHNVLKDEDISEAGDNPQPADLQKESNKSKDHSYHKPVESVKFHGKMEVEEEKQQTEEEHAIDRDSHEADGEFGKSHESLDKLLADVKENDDTSKLKQTARSKFDTTFDYPPIYNNLTLKQFDSFEQDTLNQKDKPSNQQEGDAYDTAMVDFHNRVNISNIHEDSKEQEINEPEDSSKKIQHPNEEHWEEDPDSSAHFQRAGKSQKASAVFSEFRRKGGAPLGIRFDSQKQNKAQPVEAQEFDSSSDDEVEYKVPFWARIWLYMKRSSLFIIHDSWTLRQWLIMTVMSTDTLTTKMPK